MKGHPEQALIHDIVEPNEHYRALPIASKAVEGLPEDQALKEDTSSNEEYEELNS